jgi:hypothetical protein
MALANVALTNTFDEWRTRTNQLVVQSNYYETNLPTYAYANNIGVSANAYASATIAGANTAVGDGANNFTKATLAGANTAVGNGANNFTKATLAGANTAVGDGANNFTKATLAGANTAVGNGANNFTKATLAGANTAVGNGANNYLLAVITGANTAVGDGANNFTKATLNGANTAARDATNLTSGTVPSARITGVGTITTGVWNGTVISVTYGGTGGNDQATARSGLGLGTMATQASSSVSITGGAISGLTSLAVSGAITATDDITAFSSDARLKGDIQIIADALSKVKLITGITYRHNDLAKSFGYTDESRFAGVLAQEVEAVLPEVVVPAPFDVANDGTSKSGENYKTVKYEKIVPLLIEAIKELTAKVEMLESRVNE